MPAERLNFINASINKALVSPELKKFLDNESAEAWIATPQQLANLLPTEIERYRKIAVSPLKAVWVTESPPYRFSKVRK